MSVTQRSLRIVASVCLLSAASSLAAQTTSSTIRGQVKDPLGAAIAGARVDLLANDVVLATTNADAQGRYTLAVTTAGRFQLRAAASSFDPSVTSTNYLRARSSTTLDLTVATPTLTQEITVTATGTPTPVAQVAASVTVLEDTLYPHVRDIQEPLRYIPGAQVVQTGQNGGTTSLFIRGGNSNANMVLIDGIPANDLGGAVEFANIDSAGLSSIEVLREPNSALYGSEALAGVVSLTTRRGSTPQPELNYEIDGGNFNTWRQQASLAGASHRFDYFTDFARQDTSNSLASNAFHNVTFAENAGFQPNAATDVRFTLRHVAAGGGQPNATAIYGLPDTAFLSEHDLFLGAVVDNRTTDRWHNQLRYGALRLNFLYDKPAPAGIPVYNAKGIVTSYLGAPVTLRGANGYSVSGQATLSYPGTYPSVTTNHSQRDFMYAQTDYRLDSIFGRKAHTLLLAGFKYEDERGTNASSYSFNTADRGNYSTMLELQGDAGSRFFYTLGTGLEKNAVYGFAATPRASVAYYLRRPTNASLLNGTKLHATFSKGIKGPSIYQQNNSLFDLEIAAGTPGANAQYGITPVNAESSRTYDAGLDQQIGQRARISATYFHNEFGNGLEYLGTTALTTLLGVNPAALPSSAYGAYVNSLAYRAQGLETELELKLNQHFFARAGYTLLDAKVQRSFSSSALKPTYNTTGNFSTIAIGAYSPLVGARPFRQARNSGYFNLRYSQSRLTAALNGTLVGMRDDSDFLSRSMLLPNHNLDGAYQRLELTTDYRINRHLTAYTEIQNLLSEHYSEAFGYPALPFNFRSGVRVTLGGESWRLK